MQYDLYVGGIQVTSSNASDILGDGTVSFTPASNVPAVLTLKNANVTGSRSALGQSGAGIYIGSLICVV
ncbi:MAG: hypothetical protein IJP29_06505 [Lachnospiraceae bacterium]|nr:hypothetical protein [Lachnospiraceae bacterium]